MLKPKPQRRATNQPADTDAGTQPWRADTGMGNASSLRQQRACAWWIFQTSQRHEIPEHTDKGTPDQAIGCPYLESQRRHQREKASSTRMQLNFECPVVARLRSRKDPRRSHPSLIAYSAQTLALPQDAASRVKWWGKQSWRSGYLWRYRTKLALTLRPEDGSPRLSSSAVSSATVSASASALVVIGMTCEVAGRLGVRVGGRGRERGEVGMLLLGAMLLSLPSSAERPVQLFRCYFGQPRNRKRILNWRRYLLLGRIQKKRRTNHNSLFCSCCTSYHPT